MRGGSRRDDLEGGIVEEEEESEIGEQGGGRGEGVLDQGRTWLGQSII